MFSIIISEKGGAERREAFDKNEINVGRVQGNDLMLPKGNVSKHHARLLFRDGRFIVTDLKSTNGTYVNGRKIAQATIVREGDKIYIGDFVLRLETNGAQAGAAPAETTSAEEESIRTLARERAELGLAPAPAPPPPAPAPAPQQARPAVTMKAPTHPPGAPLPKPMALNVSNAPTPGAPMAPPLGATQGNPPFTGLDVDPDDSAPLKKPSMPPPGATPLGGPVRPMTMPLNQMSPPMMGQRSPSGSLPAQSPPPPPPPGAAAPPPPAPAPTPGPAPSPPIPIAAQALQPPPRTDAPPPAPIMAPVPPAGSGVPSVRASAPPPRVPLKETPAQAGRRLALMTLLDRVSDSVELGALRESPIVSEQLAQKIETACREQANAMRTEGDAPEGIDLDSIARDAHRELVGLGAFGPLLEDEEVLEINCPRFDQIFTLRGSNVSPESIAFSSEDALSRIIARLAQQSGEPWAKGETVLERRLPRANFVAVAPPASSSHVVSIRKRRRVESTLEDLVRIGAMSKAMAQVLEASVAGRASLLVSGTAPMPLLSALASSLGAGERVVIVQDVEEIAVANANAISLTIADTRKMGEECVRAAAKLHPDRLIVTQLAGGVAAATVDAMAEGTEGVLAAMPAPTLRQALSRLVAQLVLHRPGLSLEGMRDVVGESFDLAVEVSSMPNGSLRVVRIAELGGSDPKGIVARDVFTWTPDPQGSEGSFSATGVVPRLAHDLAARGLKLDQAIFKRQGR